MVSSEDLSDAAIAIREVLDELGVQFGIFGGYAVATLGGPRESKDIDCAVHCSKNWLSSELSQRSNFRFLANKRQDIVTFLWGDRGVLVEFFPTSMIHMTTIKVDVKGRKLGASTTYILDPVIIFKGKLFAAASRNKYSDIADLTWLASHFSHELKGRSKELSRHMVGEVVKRHSHLERTFQDLIGENGLKASIGTSRNDEVTQVMKVELNQVQNGLLFGLPAAVSTERKTRSSTADSEGPGLDLSGLNLRDSESDRDGSSSDDQDDDDDDDEDNVGANAVLTPADGKALMIEALKRLMARGFTKEQAIERYREHLATKAQQTPRQPAQASSSATTRQPNQAGYRAQQAVQALMARGLTKEQAIEKHRELQAATSQRAPRKQAQESSSAVP
ncbi:hypothetical protein LTR95_008582 [Oleoguttula sp. CCFEE 5521]